MGVSHELPVTAYLVLALLAEGEAHGYELQRKVHDRGFRFWTDIKRASIYNALKRLEGLALVTSGLQEGGGPARKVYRITEEGRARFQAEGMAYLSSPGHPRDEVDLGVLAMPFMDLDTSREAVDSSIRLLSARAEFVGKRLAWCRERELELPVLNFTRSLRAIRAELEWLDELRKMLARRSEPFRLGEWEIYVYEHPPYADEHEQ